MTSLACKCSPQRSRSRVKFLSFKATGATHLSDTIGVLGPLLACNTLLVALTLDQVQGTAQATAAVCRGLAANPSSGLSVINLNGCLVGDDGAHALAQALQRLRPGLLAELHLVNCKIGGPGMASVLQALQPGGGSGGTLPGQFNLLQLHLSGNQLRGAGPTLAVLLNSLRKLEKLALAHSDVELHSFGNLLAGSLRSLRSLDLQGVAWGAELVALLNACGPHLSVVNLSGLEARMPPAQQVRFGALDLGSASKQAFLSALFQRAAAAPSMQLELSTPNAAKTLLPDVLAVLQPSRPPSPSLSLPSALVMRDSGLGDQGLLQLSEGLLRLGAGPLKSLHLDANWSLRDPSWNLQTRHAAVEALSKLVEGLSLKQLSVAGKAQCFGGPALATLFQVMLPKNLSLEYLDISANRLGDAGMVQLGTALKTNRTLTALRIDHNGLGLDPRGNVCLEGLKAIVLALKSNKRIVDLPFPDADIGAALEADANAYRSSLTTELRGRQMIKSAYGRGGYCNHSVKHQGLALLKQGKKAQSKARLDKDKLRTLVASLQASILRNQEVASIKGAGKSSNAELKLAAQAAKAAAKASEKAAATREAQKMKLWERRHVLLAKWRTAVKEGKRKMEFNDAWFTAWLRGWAKPYLTPSALGVLWRAVPPEQKEYYEALRDSMREAFAEEEAMDAKVEALLHEARTQDAEAKFHQKEAVYYASQAAKDPAAVPLKPIPSGVMQLAPPGSHRPGEFGQGPRTNWNARYQYITGSLSTAIASPVPPDFQWTPVGELHANAGVGSCAPHRIVHATPAPELVAVVMGTPVATVAAPTGRAEMGLPMAEPLPPPLPMAEPLLPPPMFADSNVAFASAVPAVAYPAIPVAQTVYAPPPPPPPPPPHMQAVTVTVPPGAMPGGMITIQLQLASAVKSAQVTVPAGHRPGMQFQALVPITQPQPPEKVFELPRPKAYFYSSHDQGGQQPQQPQQQQQQQQQQRQQQRSYNDPFLLYGYGGLGAYWMMSSYHMNHDLMYNRPYDSHNYAHHGYADQTSTGGHVSGGALPSDGVVDGGDAIGDAYGADTPLPVDMAAFEAELEADAVADDAAGGADVEVEMYGGAGPADLPDGGHGFGRPNDPIRCGMRGAPTAAWGAAARCARQAEQAAARRALKAAALVDHSDLLEIRWHELVAQAEEAVLGSLQPLHYPSRPAVLCPPAAAAAGPISLVTQCSLDRLGRLLALLKAWRGPASVALYIDETEGSEEAMAAERNARRELELELPSEIWLHLVLSLAYPPTAAAIATNGPNNFTPATGVAATADAANAEDVAKLVGHVASDDDDQHHEVLGSAAGGNGGTEHAGTPKPLYPINTLRNLALRHAPTDLVFLLDVDFVPSAGLLQELSRDAGLLARLGDVSTRTVLVVPAFEVSPAHKLPKEQVALLSLASCEPPAATPFHIDHFPAGHAPTDYATWQVASAPYQVAYADSYEPYVIASKAWLPPYDERFTGYGMNKVSHLYTVAACGAQFVVLPRHFVAAHEHAKSSSWQATFGNRADPRQRMRVAALYRRLKLSRPLPRGSATGAAATAAAALKSSSLPMTPEGRTPEDQAESERSMSRSLDTRAPVPMARGPQLCAVEEAGHLHSFGDKCARPGEPKALLECVV